MLAQPAIDPSLAAADHAVIGGYLAFPKMELGMIVLALVAGIYTIVGGLAALAAFRSRARCLDFC